MHPYVLFVQETEVLALADAIWDHVSMEPDELTFRQGDVIAITEKIHAEWWTGFTDGPIGLFPAAFVRVSCLSVLFLFMFFCCFVELPLLSC